MPARTEVVTGERPWYATASREGFTQRAAAITEASAKTKVGRSVAGRFNQ